MIIRNPSGKGISLSAFNFRGNCISPCCYRLCIQKRRIPIPESYGIEQFQRLWGRHNTVLCCIDICITAIYAVELQCTLIGGSTEGIIIQIADTFRHFHVGNTTVRKGILTNGLTGIRQINCEQLRSIHKSTFRNICHKGGTQIHGTYLGARKCFLSNSGDSLYFRRSYHSAGSSFQKFNDIFLLSVFQTVDNRIITGEIRTSLEIHRCQFLTAGERTFSHCCCGGRYCHTGQICTSLKSIIINLRSSVFQIDTTQIRTILESLLANLQQSVSGQCLGRIGRQSFRRFCGSKQIFFNGFNTVR